MIAQIASVLPDTPVEDIRRLLTSAALEQVADEQKVERVISMLLEGDLPPAEDFTKVQSSDEETRKTQEDSSPPKQSAFASIRRNIFTDSLDTSRIHRGKQDFKNDTFLPSELRASILAAAERQAQESDEDEEEEENAAYDAFAGVDEDGEALATVKVKDDVSEESGLDEEEGDMAPARQRPGSSAQNASATSSAPSLGQTGVPKDLERLYITTYTKDATVFSHEARKAPARTDLKKKIAALRLPQSIADEQIEGWARMLERNPKKDKILERFHDQQFSGNEKGLDVRQGSSQGQNKQTRKVGEGDSAGGAPGGGRGGHGERGRGRGRGRARQSDQRRRGHDRKMQKAGL